MIFVLHYTVRQPPLLLIWLDIEESVQLLLDFEELVFLWLCGITPISLQKQSQLAALTKLALSLNHCIDHALRITDIMSKVSLHFCLMDII